MAKNGKPNHRIKKIRNAKNLAKPLTRPKIDAVVELQKPNLEMHLEPPPKTGSPDVCTGNPLCYCVGVGGCSCDQVCSCDAVCAKDPDCSCVGHICTCEGYCSCEGHCSCDGHCGSYCSCDAVCTAYCTCNWDGMCDCNWVCTWYPT